MKKRQRIGHFTSHQLYRDDLLPAIRKFLPHRGVTDLLFWQAYAAACAAQ